MKKSRSLMLVLLVALTLVVNPVMAKPKPPVDPYPAPVEQVQGEAYPAPGQGLPGVQNFDPNAQTDDPRPGVPYFWGCFIEATGYWRCYISIDLGYPDFDYTGFVQLVDIGTNGWLILNFYPHAYYGEWGRTLYHTPPFNNCGDWAALYANLDGIGADIRQPNWYLIKCIFLPNLKRQA